MAMRKLEGVILALDLARQAGWAVGAMGGPAGMPLGSSQPLDRPLSGSFECGRPGDPGGPMFLKLFHFLNRQITSSGCTVMVIEKPILLRRDSMAKLRKTYGFNAIALAVAAHHGMVVKEVGLQKIKKSFTGIANASKEDMIASCEYRGWTVIDDNEADALALLEYAKGIYHSANLIRRSK